jgi:hypothetical protein
MITENIQTITKKIKEACKKSGRKPEDITLVCVTKEASLKDIIEAINNGIDNIGESRIQDAVIKYNSLKKETVTWHMIGHLQRNKVKDAVKIFDLIHSVDSLKLAQAINKEAIKQKKLVDVLIEVNTSGEKTKFGVAPKKTEELAEEITNLSNLRLLGLMTMAPMVEDPEKSRPYYKKLKEIYDEVSDKVAVAKMEYLSMGMTQDYEVAIEEGANMVRIGRAIFRG